MSALDSPPLTDPALFAQVVHAARLVGAGNFGSDVATRRSVLRSGKSALSALAESDKSFVSLFMKFELMMSYLNSSTSNQADQKWARAAARDLILSARGIAKDHPELARLDEALFQLENVEADQLFTAETNAQLGSIAVTSSFNTAVEAVPNEAKSLQTKGGMERAASNRRAARAQARVTEVEERPEDFPEIIAALGLPGKAANIEAWREGVKIIRTVQKALEHAGMFFRHENDSSLFGARPVVAALKPKMSEALVEAARRLGEVRQELGANDEIRLFDARPAPPDITGNRAHQAGRDQQTIDVDAKPEVRNVLNAPEMETGVTNGNVTRIAPGHDAGIALTLNPNI